MQKLPCRTATKITCVCCNRHMQEHLCKMYNNVDYGFTNFVVSQCLQHVSYSDENPVVPYYAKYPNAVTGANFLKALNQRLEYVCTCCHCMLFHKTVQQFHMKDYDISNETVKECLSH